MHAPCAVANYGLGTVAYWVNFPDTYIGNEPAV